MSNIQPVNIAGLVTKWKSVLEHPDLPKIDTVHKRNVTAVLLENASKAFETEGASGYAPQNLMETSPTNSAGTSGYTGSGGTAVAGYDPIMISMIRRAAPNLIAYDICGVQPMTGPSGLIFALRSNYANSTARGTETFFNEVNTAFSTIRAANSTLGESHTNTAPSGNSATYNFAGGMTTTDMESLGTSGNNSFAEMAFSIDKVVVTARGRALKAEYTMEIAQDLKAVHGLDAETELANILQTELLAEINREIVRTVNLTATPGCQSQVTTTGTFDLDTDSNGRWMVEKYKGLMMRLELEANEVARATRRGKGNIIICSADVASALQMTGVLDFTPALNANNLQVDDTGNTFVGVLNNRFRVYIDPYTTVDYATVGYKGANAFDAGLFYCPYIPLQMVRGVDPNSFQPKIGFKTRYGVVANPFSRGATTSDGSLVQNVNVYYRRSRITNIL